MKTLLGTKTKISTKTAVALVAGAVILAAAAAGGFSFKNKRSLNGDTAGYNTPGYNSIKRVPDSTLKKQAEDFRDNN